MPSPSRVGPRSTVTPRAGTSEKRIVLLFDGEDGLGEIEADLGGVDVEGGDELGVADVIAARASTCMRPGTRSLGSASR